MTPTRKNRIEIHKLLNGAQKLQTIYKIVKLENVNYIKLITRVVKVFCKKNIYVEK